MQLQGLIDVWPDRDMSTGTEGARQSDVHLNAASIILLLVSPAFMNSDYCYGVEMQRALERHAAGEARVIPILLRPVDWQSMPFAHMQWLPSDARPVTSWRNLDEAFVEVARGIRKMVEELTKQP